jgi:hypothetical protein
MDMLLYIVLGALLLVALSIGGGMIIRKTGRKQSGAAFYGSMITLVLTLAYGVLPMLALTGMTKTIVYALSAGASVLFSHFVFGEKLEQK